MRHMNRRENILLILQGLSSFYSYIYNNKFTFWIFLTNKSILLNQIFPLCKQTCASKHNLYEFKLNSVDCKMCFMLCYFVIFVASFTGTGVTFLYQSTNYLGVLSKYHEKLLVVQHLNFSRLLIIIVHWQFPCINDGVTLCKQKELFKLN